MLARLLGNSLDRRLAHGGAPESSRLMAARAQVLVSPLTRRALIQNWQGLLLRAHSAPVMRDPRVPFNRAHLVACQPEIEEVLEAAVGPAADSRARRGHGRRAPQRRRRTSLRSAPVEQLVTLVRETIAQLDPARSLSPATYPAACRCPASHEIRAAVDVDVSTGHVAVGSGGQVGGERRNLLGKAGSAQIGRLMEVLIDPLHDVVGVGGIESSASNVALRPSLKLAVTIDPGSPC